LVESRLRELAVSFYLSITRSLIFVQACGEKTLDILRDSHKERYVYFSLFGVRPLI